MVSGKAITRERASLEFEEKVIAHQPPKKVWGRLFCIRKEKAPRVETPSYEIQDTAYEKKKLSYFELRFIKKQLSKFSSPPTQDNVENIYKILGLLPKEQRKESIAFVLGILQSLPAVYLTEAIEIFLELPDPSLLPAFDLLDCFNEYEMRQFVEGLLNTEPGERIEHLLCVIHLFQFLSAERDVLSNKKWIFLADFGGVSSRELTKLLQAIDQAGFDKAKVSTDFVQALDGVDYLLCNQFVCCMRNVIEIQAVETTNYISVLNELSIKIPNVLSKHLFFLESDKLKHYLDKLIVIHNFLYQPITSSVKCPDIFFNVISQCSMEDLNFALEKISSRSTANIPQTLDNIIYITFYLSLSEDGFRKAARFFHLSDTDGFESFIDFINDIAEVERYQNCMRVVEFFCGFENELTILSQNALNIDSFFDRFRTLPSKLRGPLGLKILESPRAKELFPYLVEADIKFASIAQTANPSLFQEFIRQENGREWVKKNSSKIAQEYPPLFSFLVSQFPPDDNNYCLYPPSIIVRGSIMTCHSHLVCCISVARAFVNNAPIETAEAIYRHLSPIPDAFNVHYIGERGLDSGALTKDFFANYHRGLIEHKFIVKGWPAWKDNVDEEKQQKLFETIGRLHSFIVKSKGAHPIGEVFDLRFFDVMQEFLLTELRGPFGNVALETKIHFFCTIAPLINNNNFVKRLVAFLSAKDEESIFQSAEVLQELYLSIGQKVPGKYLNDACKIDPIKVWQHKSEIWTDTYAAINSLFQFDNQLKSIFYIAKGFFMDGELWKVLEELSFPPLHRLIQGHLDRDFLLKQTTFKSNVKKEVVIAVRNWIKTTDETRLRNFLDYMTGSPALSQDTAIKIKEIKSPPLIPLQDIKIHAHSCFGIIDIPLGTASDTVIAFLDIFQTRLKDGFQLQ